MTRLVTKVLEAIDTHWKDSNYDPMPVRIDRDEPKRLDTGERTKSIDLTEANAVGASSAPTSTLQAYLGGYSVDAGVIVRVEGVHQDQRGHVADADDWKSLVDEVKRTIDQEREHPIPSENYHTLVLKTEDNLSSDHANYFRTDIAVGFLGYYEP